MWSLGMGLVRFFVLAQLVDAALSNDLIQQHFSETTDLSGCTQSKPSEGSVSFNSLPLSDFGR